MQFQARSLLKLEKDLCNATSAVATKTACAAVAGASSCHSCQASNGEHRTIWTITQPQRQQLRQYMMQKAQVNLLRRWWKTPCTMRRKLDFRITRGLHLVVQVCRTFSARLLLSSVLPPLSRTLLSSATCQSKPGQRSQRTSAQTFRCSSCATIAHQGKDCMQAMLLLLYKRWKQPVEVVLRHDWEETHTVRATQGQSLPLSGGR